MSAEPDRRRDHLDHLGATTSSSVATLRHAQSRSLDVIPPGSGVPVPGRRPGRARPRRQSGRRARRRTSSSARATIARSRASHVVHEEARDPALGLPRELLFAGPVAAQADLHVALGSRAPPRRAGTSASRARPRRRRPPGRCRCGCRSGRGRPGRAARRTARMSGSAIEWSPPSTIGMAPAATTSPTVRTIASCEAAGSAGITAASPKSTTRSSATHRRPSRGAARAGSSRRGSRAARSGFRAGPRRGRPSARRRWRRRPRRARPGPACTACRRT